MAFDVINLGSAANDGTGDSIRFGGTKINNNFAKAAEVAIGTFTPTLKAAVSNPTVTYTTQRGRYMRIGPLVYFALRVETSAVSGGSSSIRIADLPYTIAGTSGQNDDVFSIMPSNLTMPSGGLFFAAYGLAGTTNMQINYVRSANTATGLVIANWAANGAVTISGTYRTTQAI